MWAYPCSCLGFLTAWHLGSKREEVKAACFLKGQAQSGHHFHWVLVPAQTQGVTCKLHILMEEGHMCTERVGIVWSHLWRLATTSLILHMRKLRLRNGTRGSGGGRIIELAFIKLFLCAQYGAGYSHMQSHNSQVRQEQ